MRLSRGRVVLVASLFLLMDGIAFAQYEVGIPVPNWTVPAYRASSASGGLSTMADISPGIAFVAMQPCRVFDTRGAVGPYGGPRLLANTTRNFDIDSGPCTGIPTGVDAYSMNFGAILPDGLNSFVTIWPTGTAQPLVSSINPIQGGVVANAAIVPAGTNGAISVFPNTGLHLYGDINGYFTDRYNPGVSFHAVSSNAAPAILGENLSTAVGAAAIKGLITSTTPASSSVAVLGVNNSTTGSGIGVWGSHGGGGIGVLGEAQLGGVGVFGAGLGTTQISFGVEGQSASPQFGSAGVFGFQGSRLPTGSYGPAGVRGESQSGIGVLGLSQSGTGVSGARVDANGNAITVGWLGLNGLGISSFGDASIMGNLAVTGMKAFVQPHPFDANKEIRYVALEGARSDVYFRGTAQIARGITQIQVPDDFRFVADPKTYSTLITPVDEMATVAVIAESPDGIVLKASRDVKVHYVVYAEREAVRNTDPIVSNVDFQPDPRGELLRHLPESYRQLMIQNHTLNPDGSVNMETAHRLGWDKEWEKRERPAPQPAPE